MITETSRQAYEKIVEELPERRLQVYKAIEHIQYATNAMISRYLNLPINCITGRTNELRKLKLVEKSHISWCPVTKNKATYWKLIPREN